MSDDKFNRLSDDGLKSLSDDELIAYIRTASDAGQPGATQRATAILCFRRFDDVHRRVAIKVPRQDAEDVAMDAMLSAIRSAFAGVSKGEFVNWLHTIVARRIADYHRTREDKPAPGPLPTEHQGEEEVWGAEPAESDRAGEVVVQSVIDGCLAELSPPHRDAVVRNVFDDLDAAATAAQVNGAFPGLDPPMSAQNVHKIVSRFRESVRERLAAEG